MGDLPSAIASAAASVTVSTVGGRGRTRRGRRGFPVGITEAPGRGPRDEDTREKQCQGGPAACTAGLAEQVSADMAVSLGQRKGPHPAVWQYGPLGMRHTFRYLRNAKNAASAGIGVVVARIERSWPARRPSR